MVCMKTGIYLDLLYSIRLDYIIGFVILEKVLDFQKTSMFLTDTSEDIDAHFRYMGSKKHRCIFRSGHP